MAPARHEPSSLLDLQAFHRPRGFCQTETWSSRSRSHPNSGSSSYGFFKDSDFLAALTCIADLYSKPDVLPMRLADSASDEEQFITGQGALARVTRRNTDVDLPSSAQANQVQRRTLRLATKKYKDQCWDANGEPIDHNAKSLLTELTILSHSGVRDSNYVARIWGIEWDDCQNIPLPSPRLELADWNLSEFLQKYDSLPIRTKWQLAFDIASGLLTLHANGVIHGDIKPQNVLIFESAGNYHAKVADFTHSFLDTGEHRLLPGGTCEYAAPEWREGNGTNVLKLTDVYSFGLTFACLMIGKDVFAKARDEGTWMAMHRRRVDDSECAYLRQIIWSLDIEDLDISSQILSLTVQWNPGARDLEKALPKIVKAVSKYSKRPSIPSSIPDKVETIPEKLGSTKALDIPYHALTQMPSSLHKYIVRSLEHCGSTERGSRAAAAAFQVAVCYSSGFGTQDETSLDDRAAEDCAMKWIVQAATEGNQEARLSVVPMFAAFGGCLPRDLPVRQWLQDLVDNEGSAKALWHLQQLDPALHRDVLKCYRRTYCGQSFRPFRHDITKESLRDPMAPQNDRGDSALHYAASIGDLELLGYLKSTFDISDIINCRNLDGDTPLLQAVRSGHAEMIRRLVTLGADASIPNNHNETVLHFLVSLDEEDVPDIAHLLAGAGAHAQIQKISYGSSSTWSRGGPIPSMGSAALRAVCCNRLDVLQALFDVESSFPEEDLELKTSTPVLLRLIANALRLHHVNVLHMIGERIGDALRSEIDTPAFWHENDNTLRTLLENSVFGCVSSHDPSLNFPERFTRITRLGADFNEALTPCFDFLLSHGAAVEEDGIVKFAIANRRRDAVLWLVQNSCSPLLWVKTAITTGSHDILRRLFQLHEDHKNSRGSQCHKTNFPFIFITEMVAANADIHVLNLVRKWLEVNFPQRKVQWQLSDNKDISRLRKLVPSTVATGERLLHPLTLALQRKHWLAVDLLFEFGSSLQDFATDRMTNLAFLLRYRLLQPGELTGVLKSAIKYAPRNMIRLSDLGAILVHGLTPGVIFADQKRDSIVCHYQYTKPVSWSTPDAVLNWAQGPDALRQTRELWEHVSEAIRTQETPLDARLNGRLQRNSLILHACFQSNPTAVKCLLDVGMHPDATGSYEVFHILPPGHTLPISRPPGKKEWDSFRIRITPLDAVNWTSYVPDQQCSEAGLRLKAVNEEIARLLRLHGGSHSRIYSPVYQLFWLPWLEAAGIFRYYFSQNTWDGEEFVPIDDEHHQLGPAGMMCFGILCFSVTLLSSLSSLSRDIKEGALHSDTVVSSVMLGVMLACLVCLFMAFAPRILEEGPRRRADLQFAFGGNPALREAAVLRGRGILDHLLPRIWSPPEPNVVVDGDQSAPLLQSEEPPLVGTYGAVVHSDVYRIA